MSDGIWPREELERAYEHAEDLTALVESIRGDLDLITTNLEAAATNQLTKQQASALRQLAQQAAGKALMLVMGTQSVKSK